MYKVVSSSFDSGILASKVGKIIISIDEEVDLDRLEQTKAESKDKGFDLLMYCNKHKTDFTESS